VKQQMHALGLPGARRGKRVRTTTADAADLEAVRWAHSYELARHAAA
jgi:hypothetical protein